MKNLKQSKNLKILTSRAYLTKSLRELRIEQFYNNFALRGDWTKNRKKTKIASTTRDVMNKSTQRRALSGRNFNQLIFIAMPTFGYELRSFIQRCIWVGPQDSQFSAGFNV